MAEQPKPKDDDPARSKPASKRIPKSDPKAREKGKRYIVPDAPLKVTVDGGEVAEGYAPGALMARMIGGVSATLKAIGGGFTPMTYAIVPSQSMTIYFGDPDPTGEQAILPVEFTLSNAQLVAELLELEGEDFLRRALLIGLPMRHYRDLAHDVQREGVRLQWDVRGQSPRLLTTERAYQHYTLLNERPQMQDRPITVNGTLYRVITEIDREPYLGSVGIHLYKWSIRPPRVRPKGRIIAYYEDRDVGDAIKQGLIGDPVQARLFIRHPIPGTSIEASRYHLVLKELAGGPPEAERTASIFSQIDDGELDLAPEDNADADA